MFKRLIRYLQRERHWVRLISYWKVGRRVGDIFRIRFGSLQGNRKSTSAGVTLLGSHTLKAYTRRQTIIARSRAEAEVYAAPLGASEPKGIVVVV